MKIVQGYGLSGGAGSGPAALEIQHNGSPAASIPAASSITLALSGGVKQALWGTAATIYKDGIDSGLSVTAAGLRAGTALDVSSLASAAGHTIRAQIGTGVDAIVSQDVTLQALPQTLATIYTDLNGGAPVYAHGDATYLTSAQGRITDTAGWVAQTVNGGLTFADGAIKFATAAGQQKARHNLLASIPSGTRVRVSWLQSGTGGVRLAVGSDSASGYQSNPGYWFADVTTSALRTWFEVQQQGGTGAVDVTNITVRALNPATSDYDVIVLAGQSNMVGASAGALPDPAIDMPHPMVDVMHGSTNSGMLSTAGAVTGAAPSFQHRALNQGLGPGMAFARWYADNVLAVGRRVLLVAAAKGGTNLINPTTAEAPWHPDNTIANAELDLYTRAVADTNAAKALGGTNTVVAMLWSQGEADRGASAAPVYRDTFADTFAPRFRTDVGVANLPIVIMGLNPAVSDANTDAMRAAQAELDKDSGHPKAVPACIYNEWDTANWGDGTKPSPNDEEDRVHYGVEANRVRGVDAAIKFASRLTVAVALTFGGASLTYNSQPVTYQQGA